MKLTMIGTGYVGLVSGTCFAELGHQVVCVDKDPAKIDTLLKGGVPIFEPGLDDLISRNVARERLSFSTDLPGALDGADAIFICVGTPPRPDDGQADLQYVYAAAEEVARNLRGYSVIVTKSTVPVGTNREVLRRARAVAPDAAFDVASNPEFLREGAAIRDFLEPTRVVVGAETREAHDIMAEIYAPLTEKGFAYMASTLETAEMVKYAANAFLATKIAFINEVANLCEKVGADVGKVARGIGLDDRIGAKFLNAGPGFGGSCFPKDTQALAYTAQSYDAPTQIVETVIASNTARKRAMAHKIIEAAEGVAGKTVAVLGAAFKGGTDDVRDSPAVAIMRVLAEQGATIRCHDPAAMRNAAQLLDGVTWCDTVEDAVAGAEFAAILTEWPEFGRLDLRALKAALKTPLLVDLRNLYDPARVASAGLTYVSIGRAAAHPGGPEAERLRIVAAR